jgi:hypothetical protein
MSVRRDALYPLRLIGIGFVRGYAHAAASDRMAVELEAKAGALLHALDVPYDVARDIIDQSRYDAGIEHPDLDAVEQRALAAARIILCIRQRVAVMQNQEAA